MFWNTSVIKLTKKTYLTNSTRKSTVSDYDVKKKVADANKRSLVSINVIANASVYEFTLVVKN